MNITDLKIGNLLQTISEEPDIIVVDKIDAVEQTVSGSGLEDISIEDLAGIPLTEKYFLDNGFIQQKENKKRYIHKETEFEMFCDESSKVFIHPIHKSNGVTQNFCFYYVHNIQNFYYQIKHVEISDKNQFYSVE